MQRDMMSAVGHIAGAFHYELKDDIEDNAEIGH